MSAYSTKTSKSSHMMAMKSAESVDNRLPQILGDIHHNFTSVEAYWPRRLLHIPTMMSIERTGQDTYNHVKKPAYGILTYTWGRWKRRGSDGFGPALAVKGTPWEIPSVKEEHFTVEAFYAVVQRIGEEVDWAWIDVACIEQREQDLETRRVKMDEIGRQVGIFKNAQLAFVWLSHLGTEALAKDLDNLWHHGPKLAKRQEYTSLEGILSTLEKSLSAILQDPWFSSLWTLQEMILRKDALILTREANTLPLTYLPEQEVSLPVLVNACANIHRDLTYFRAEQAIIWTKISSLFHKNPNLDRLTVKLLENINKAGFSFLLSSNPNVQYGVARYRETRRPLDRIYGIMQIYNIRVGEAINPDRTPTLYELEDEFAAAICAQCPILGQSFVHLKSPDPGKAWRISQFSRVPDELIVSKSANPTCTISLTSLPGGPRQATFQGKKCPLFALSMLWAELRKAFLEDRGDAGALRIIVDEHCFEDLSIPQPGKLYFPRTEATMDSITHPANVVELCKKYGKDSVDVLELGTLESRSEYQRKSSSERMAAPTRIGMVARQVLVDEGQMVYERLGLCIWNNLKAFGEAGETFDQKVPWEACEVVLS